MSVASFCRVRFIQHCGSPDLASFGEGESKAFLTELAVERDVTAGTQKQAKCALLFLYQIGRFHRVPRRGIMEGRGLNVPPAFRKHGSRDTDEPFCRTFPLDAL